MGRRRRFEGRLGNAVTIAICLLIAAVVLWIPAIGFGDGTACPPGPRTGEGRLPQPTGLDTPRSVWPPGVECTIYSQSRKGGFVEKGHYVEEVVPGAGWVLASLVGAAVLVLLGGVLAEIRELRRDGRASAAPNVRRAC